MSDAQSAAVNDSDRATHLKLAEDAFDRGNYREVRRLVAEIRAHQPLGAANQAAEELLRRTQPDPLVKYLLLLSGLLLLAVAIFSYRQAMH